MGTGSKFFFLSFFIAFSAFILIFKIITAKNRRRVQLYSSKLKSIKRANETYHFHSIAPEFLYEEYVDSKLKFDNFSFEQYMERVIYEDKTIFERILAQVIENRDKYQSYKKEIYADSEKQTAADAEKCGMPVDKFRKIESSLLKKEELVPIKNVTFRMIVRYTSPKGRNSYQREKTFEISDIAKLFLSVNKKESREAQIRHERSLMTPKIRYDVMKRDGFRCQICGRKQSDGVLLHVDHIIPVSKGGKTEPDNLRTLCDDCNRGKGSSYDPFGEN